MSNSNNFTKRIRKYGAFSLSALLLSSCVNDKYDLSKEIDTSLSLFEDGISMPVGSTDTIFMKQIIEIEENGEIKIDRSTGDYYLYKSEKTDTDMNFNIEDSNVDADGMEPFTLITDPDHTLLEQFGAWGEKVMCGKTRMGVLRSTSNP